MEWLEGTAERANVLSANWVPRQSVAAANMEEVPLALQPSPRLSDAVLVLRQQHATAPSAKCGIIRTTQIVITRLVDEDEQ